ncbi:pyridoxamine 5'-phosphate oxidase family protein [Streptomyces sp. NPDC021098]|uniref:pyridoxamine 5'-phosphate oxidase family protein n=1 Tax=unclassified Streptomyces TaxID=2593676 RepID=UPI003794ACB7
MGTADRADRFYDEQVLDHLNVRMREFVGRQEMFFLATSDRHGECDSSFRAGPPGFLRVLDGRTLAYPEYRGNGVLASLGNIEENPHLGIMMIDFFRDRIGLHVNGRARVVEDDEMRARHPGLPVDPIPGRRAVVWVEVAVEEAYIHCAKHIPHLQKVPSGRRARAADGPRSDRPRDPQRGRAWGTDDVKRKGGDFFGAAAEARERHRTPPVEPPAVPSPQPQAQAPQAPIPQIPHPQAPVPAAPAAAPQASDPQTPAPQQAARPEEWLEEAERVLADARRRAAEKGPQPFSGWFR